MDDQQLDSGITFALARSPLPATAWMLYYIIGLDAPSTLLPRVIEAIEKARMPTGELDVPMLVTHPLVKSIWTETLRLYIDVLVTRNLKHNLLVSGDEEGKRVVALRKGDNLFKPTWLSHHDVSRWTSSSAAPPERFDAERFLDKESKTGGEVFRMRRTNGTFIPFEGGSHTSPGRILAKQKSLAALAVVLPRFQLDVKG